MGIIRSRAIVRRLAILALFVCTFSHAAIPPSERAVLDSFYQQTGGPNWTNNSGWEGAAGSECSWFGIICTIGSDHIQYIMLPSNGLTGTLPPLANLTQLQSINFGSNQLTGSIPTLNGLSQLQSVFLGNNKFTGSIPSLSGLSNLRDFYVFQNQLTGSIPPLTGLTNLQYMYVHSNQLTGNLPSLAGLTGLIEFRAQLNQLSGSIPPLAGLSSLQIYGVGSNQLTGTLPSFAGLANLQVFNAYTNQLTGTIPALSGLTNLKQINVSSNSLSGNIPAVAGLVNLNYLVFDENQLTGSIPALNGLTNLLAFTASNNHLTGSIPILSSLVNLSQFWAYNNQLTGGIPALSGLVNLEDFEVDGNHLTGNLPALTGLTKLTTILAGFNPLTGSLPSLTGLGNLQTFVVRDTQLTGNIPSLAGLANLQIFAVFNSQLTGSIPPLTGLTNLKLFGVLNNQLTGPIPTLTGLSNLSFFSVANNRLTGSIPSLANLPALQYLQVGGNGLSGNVPAAPATLLSVPFAQSPSLGQSSLCNNALNPTVDSGWDTATGVKPWYSTCTTSPSVLTLTTADTTVATGTSTTITATITASASTMSTAKALIADVAGANMGTVTVTDDQGKLICYIVIVNNTGSCTVVLPTGTTNIIGGYSGTPSITPTSAGFSKTNNVPSSSLDQHGWTGAWYNRATSGQGFVIEVYPDLNAPGTGLFGGSWFTFDTSAGGEDHQRWYTLSGDAPSTVTSTTLDIYANEGGNFSAPPVINTANGKAVVGHAAISFSSCGSANFYYSFTDGSGRLDTIPLTRLDQNVTCDEKNGAGNGATAGSFLLSGAWYDPATSGQGLLFDVNPPLNVTFAAWYTYAPGGQAIGGGASQRWYTLQATPTAAASVGTAPLAMTIYSSVGGVFNTANSVHQASTSAVGTASITFSSCTALTLSYTFNTGTNNGLSGDLNLRRVGPTPAGCNL